MNVATQCCGVHLAKVLKAPGSSRKRDRLICIERHWVSALVYVASHLSKRR